MDNYLSIFKDINIRLPKDIFVKLVIIDSGSEAVFSKEGFKSIDSAWKKAPGTSLCELHLASKDLKSLINGEQSLKALHEAGQVQLKGELAAGLFAHRIFDSFSP